MLAIWQADGEIDLKRAADIFTQQRPERAPRRALRDLASQIAPRQCVIAARRSGFPQRRLSGQPPLGVITIAGPTVRFTEARMSALGEELVSFAAQMAAASGASPYFNQRLARVGRQALAQPIYAP